MMIAAKLAIEGYTVTLTPPEGSDQSHQENIH